MTGPSSYSGGTTVAGGALFIDNSNGLQTSTGVGNVTVSGGTFGGVGNVGNLAVFGATTVSVSAGAMLYAGHPRVGDTSPAYGTLNIEGALNLAASANLEFDFAPKGNGQVQATSITLNGPVTVKALIGGLSGANQSFPIILGTNNYSMLTLGAHQTNYSFTFSSSNSSEIDLNATYLGAANLTWAGGNGNYWGGTACLFSGGMSDGSLCPSNVGDNVTFSDSAGSANSSITIPGSASPASMTFSNATVAYTLSKGTITVGTISGAGPASIGPDALNLTGPGGVASNVTLWNSGSLNVTGGTHTVAAVGDVTNFTTLGTTTVSNATLKAAALFQAALNLNAGGEIVLTGPSGYGNNNNYVNTLNLNGGVFDVQAAGLQVANGGTAALFSAIQKASCQTILPNGNGYGNVNWSASNGGITSATAAANPSAMGIALQPASTANGNYNVVQSEPLGDIQLQGVVTAQDVGTVRANVGAANVGWAGGDFYYQGYVSLNDLNAALRNKVTGGPMKPAVQIGGSGSAVVDYNPSSGQLSLVIAGDPDINNFQVYCDAAAAHPNGS